MAEEEGAAGADEQQINGEDSMPQAGIISQYVKDMSFENPNAPAVYQWQGNPRIDVQFNIGTAQLNDEIYEVSLQIDVTATGEQTAFKCELVYAGLFGLRNIPQSSSSPSFSPRRRGSCSRSPGRSSLRRSRMAASRLCFSTRSISASFTCSRPRSRRPSRAAAPPAR